MKNLARLCLLVLLTASAGATAAPQARVPGQALVKLQPALVQTEALRDIQERTGIELLHVRDSLFGWGIYRIAEGAEPLDEEATLRAVDTLAQDPAVAAASDNRWYTKLSVPNDPGFDNMWHLDIIGADPAWDITTGLSSQRIGVVDTGTVRAHEDLAAKDVGGYDFIDNSEQANDGNGRDSDYDDAGDGADCGFGFQPDSFHGSHVAGTILAATNNGEGIAGLNWAAGLVTVRALGRCGGNLVDIMEGSAWLAGASINGVPDLPAEDRVSVMNLSLGGPGGCSSFEQDYIDFINGQNVMFVAAAGNDAGPVGSPGNCSGVITVAAHGPGANRPLSSFSNFGTSVEIVAPGGDQQTNQNQGVLSAIGPGSSDYSWYQGTSMASPHVAGAISLMQAIDPGLTRTEINTFLQDTGVACGGCDTRVSLQLDALLAAVSASVGGVIPEPEPQPEPEPVEPEPVADDSFEPNNDYASAPFVTCGQSADLVLAPGDIDWFRIDVGAGSDITVTIDAGDQDFDLYLTTGGTNDDIIGGSQTPTGQESVALTAPVDVLGIAVQPWETATGPYTLGVTCAGQDPLPVEPEPSPGEPEPDPGLVEEPPVTGSPLPGGPTAPSEDPDGPNPGDPADPADDDITDSVDDDQQPLRSDPDQLSGGCTQTDAGSVLGWLAFAGLFASRRRRR